MRTVYCACGARLEADDDQSLTKQYCVHVVRMHPDRDLTDEHVRAVMVNAFDADGMQQAGEQHQTAKPPNLEA